MFNFMGDFGPGGGFQAGVIVASAFILFSLVFGIEAGKRLFPSTINLVLLALGGIIYGWCRNCFNDFRG